MAELTAYVYIVSNSTFNTVLHCFGLYLLITTKIRRSKKAVNHLYLVNYAASVLLKNIAYVLFSVLRWAGSLEEVTLHRPRLFHIFSLIAKIFSHN